MEGAVRLELDVETFPSRRSREPTLVGLDRLSGEGAGLVVLAPVDEVAVSPDRGEGHARVLAGSRADVGGEPQLKGPGAVELHALQVVELHGHEAGSGRVLDAPRRAAHDPLPLLHARDEHAAEHWGVVGTVMPRAGSFALDALAQKQRGLVDAVGRLSLGHLLERGGKTECSSRRFTG